MHVYDFVLDLFHQRLRVHPLAYLLKVDDLVGAGHFPVIVEAQVDLPEGSPSQLLLLTVGQPLSNLFNFQVLHINSITDTINLYLPLSYLMTSFDPSNKCPMDQVRCLDRPSRPTTRAVTSRIMACSSLSSSIGPLTSYPETSISFFKTDTGISISIFIGELILVDLFSFSVFSGCFFREQHPIPLIVLAL